MENLNITVDLKEVKTYIQGENFINFLNNTTTLSNSLFIQSVLNKTIYYMEEDNNNNNENDNKDN